MKCLKKYLTALLLPFLCSAAVACSSFPFDLLGGSEPDGEEVSEEGVFDTEADATEEAEAETDVEESSADPASDEGSSSAAETSTKNSAGSCAERAEDLPSSYNCYIDEPSEEAWDIFESCHDKFDKEAQIQGERNPPVTEFLVRRGLKSAADGAEEYPSPFPDAPLPYFMQWDQRWAFVKYTDGLFGQTGCGPAALSMVYTGLTGKTDYLPDKMAKFAERNFYATKNDGTSWLMMSKGAKKLGLEVEELPLDRDVMTNALDEGRPIILILGPGDFTSTGHYIVVYDYEDEGFRVFDPFSLSNSKKLWPYSVLEGQIRNIWAYRAAG